VDVFLVPFSAIYMEAGRIDHDQGRAITVFIPVATNMFMPFIHAVISTISILCFTLLVPISAI